MSCGLANKVGDPNGIACLRQASQMRLCLLDLSRMAGRVFETLWVGMSCGLANRVGDPNGIRTRVTAVKGRCPRPLDDRVSERREAEDGAKRAGVQGKRRASLKRHSFQLPGKPRPSFSPRLYLSHSEKDFPARSRGAIWGFRPTGIGQWMPVSGSFQRRMRSFWGE